MSALRLKRRARVKPESLRLNLKSFDTKRRILLRLAEVALKDRTLRGGVEGEQWVFLMPPGELVYEGEKLNLDEDFLRLVASETNRALTETAKRAPKGSTPWTFPVLRDHQTIGRREGDIIQARYATAKGLTGLWALVRWHPDTYQEIKDKKVTHVSMGINPVWDDERGNSYGPLLWELSVTSHPRAKEIGSLQDTLTIQMSDTAQEARMDPQTFLTAMSELLNQLRAGIKEDMAALLAQATSVQAMEEEEETITANEEEEKIEASEEELDPTVALSHRFDRMEKLLLGKVTGLNFQQRSAGGKKTPNAQRTAPTLEQIKKKTGLSGKPAVDAWLAAGGR